MDRNTFKLFETEEVPPHISASALNKWLFNRDTVEKVLKHLMSYGFKIEGGDKLGKTIIFAANKEHAYFIEKVFPEMYPRYLSKFMQMIECSISHVQHRIDNFYHGGKNPFIAVSIDMLDTGIDVHEIVNLVFFKVVRSRAKFRQMVGPTDKVESAQETANGLPALYWLNWKKKRRLKRRLPIGNGKQQCNHF